ncbi:ECF transporter S component [Bacillus tuaregi]|uniref:ECF transporter S component n=1 Tax=Bacillus tuaregi TaxID=1816695 RepID=UPI0008F8EAB6|nr:ECF transporter S component [Bacillus tuaregi]
MNIKRISLISLFIALSVVGASIKIPAVVSSVALDMVPALIAGALIGSLPGAFVALFGHLVSALIGGMPLGPFHFLIAVEMALLAWLFTEIYRKGKGILASILFVIGNTFLSPLPFLFIMGTGFYIGMIPSLLIGSLLNTILALLLSSRLANVFLHKETVK